eukprot:gene719-1183_t
MEYGTVVGRLHAEWPDLRAPHRGLTSKRLAVGSSPVARAVFGPSRLLKQLQGLPPGSDYPSPFPPGSPIPSIPPPVVQPQFPPIVSPPPPSPAPGASLPAAQHQFPPAAPPTPASPTALLPPGGTIGTAVIDNETTAAAELAEHISTPATSAVILRTDVALEDELPAIARQFSLTGECHPATGYNTGYCVLDAGGRCRVLQVSGAQGSLSLTHVHLTNGHIRGAENMGGGGLLIYNGASATVNECHVSDCVAESEVLGGGGVAALGATLWMANTVVSNNTVDMALGGAGVGLMGSSGALVNCSIINNTIIASIGGGGVGVIDFSQASPSGTAAGGTNFTMEGCYIGENLGLGAWGGAGVGICPTMPAFASMSVRLIGSAVHGNVLEHGSSDSYAFGGGLFGFGLADFPLLLLISETVFSLNSALKEGGGLMFWLFSTSELTDSVVVDNRAGTFGGGFSSIDAVLTVAGTRVAGNAARYGGGASVRYKATAELGRDSSYTVNLEQNELQGNSADDFGGGMYLEEVDVLLRSNIVAENVAERGAGMYATEVSTNLSQCHFVDNWSIGYGGGMYLVDNHLDFHILDTTVASCKSQVNGGGVYAVSKFSALNLRLVDNVAQYEGGGMYIGSFLSTLVFLLNITLEHGFAGDRGGGLCINDGEVTIENLSVRACEASAAGGGILVTQESSLTLSTSHIEGNLAPTGAGLCVESSNVSIHSSKIMWNNASIGGGLAARSLARVSIYGSELSNSASTDGGSVHVDECARFVEVEGTVFGTSSAQRGGAVYLQYPHTGTQLAFQALTFAEDDAEALGGYFFWEHRAAATLECNFEEWQVQQVEPQCDRCLWSNRSALFVTTAASYKITQDGRDVDSLLQIRSGEVIAPPLVYEARDYYGALTHIVGGTNVFVTASSLNGAGSRRRRLSEEAEVHGVVVGGQTLERYVHASSEEELEYGAQFDSLSIASKPGSALTVSFSPESAEWADVAVQAVVALCERGEVYSEEHETCTPCEEGLIKFDNSSAACSPCTDTALECHGGSSFTLRNGMWMAVDSIALACGTGGSVLCVLDRTYECPVEAACEPSELDRRNVDGAPWVERAALCADGYSTAVVVCGTCEAGHYMTVTDHCVECPESSVATAVHAAMMGVGVLLGLWLLRVLLLRRVRAASRSREDKGRLRTAPIHNMTLADSAAETAAQEEVSMEEEELVHHGCDIWFGWVQVVAQTAQVFPRATVPAPFLEFLAKIEVFDVNLAYWLSLPCLGVANAFRWSFAMSACLPLVVIAPVASMLTKHWLCRGRRHDAASVKEAAFEREMGSWARRLASAEALPREVVHGWLPLTSFLLRQVHPSVSTRMFAIFAYDTIHLEAEHATAWCAPET